MLRRHDAPTTATTTTERRLFQLKIALALVGALFFLSITLVLARPSRASAVTPAASPEPATRPSVALEPRVNEYMLGDRYVLQMLVPGVYPELEVDLDPTTRKTVLTVTGTPIDAIGLDATRFNRKEWHPTPFKRKIELPDGVSTPETVLKDGVLTLSFPMKVTVPGRIQPRRPTE